MVQDRDSYILYPKNCPEHKGVLDGQLYLVDFNDNNVELDTCLIAKTNMGWL
jgi:hypothetical protein